MVTIVSPFAGEAVPLDEVDDDVFSQRIVGEGLALRPPVEGGAFEVRAPVTGRIEKLFPGGHGIAIETASGVQVLIHIGLNTVHLEGDGFTTHIVQGDDIRTGDLMVTVDSARLHALDVDTITPIVVISDHAVTGVAAGAISTGEPLLEVAD